MNKQNIYDELKADGAKLKAVNFYSLEQLNALYLERFGKSPEKSDKPDKPAQPDKPARPAAIRTLVFDRSGWCEELHASYFQGVYRPATVNEYLTLRRFAAREI